MRSYAVGREDGYQRPADLARGVGNLVWLLRGAQAPHASHRFMVSCLQPVHGFTVMYRQVNRTSRLCSAQEWYLLHRAAEMHTAYVLNIFRYHVLRAIAQ